MTPKADMGVVREWSANSASSRDDTAPCMPCPIQTAHIAR